LIDAVAAGRVANDTYDRDMTVVVIGILDVQIGAA